MAFELLDSVDSGAVILHLISHYFLELCGNFRVAVLCQLFLGVQVFLAHG